LSDTKISALTALTGANLADDDNFVVVDTSVTTTKRITAAELRTGLGLPPGLVFPYAGTAAPAGFLLCYGQAVAQATYPALYAVLGTTYGVDSGGNFTLPDLRGRVVAGQDDMGGSSANRLTNPASTTGGIDGDVLGGTGGLETHVITTAQLATHTHSGTTSSDGAHTHSVDINQVGSGAAAAQFVNPSDAFSAATTSSNGSHTHTMTTNSAGTDAAHNNVQPTLILNYIIKT